MPLSFRHEGVAPVEYNDNVRRKEAGMSPLCMCTLARLLELSSEVWHFMLLLCTKYEA